MSNNNRLPSALNVEQLNKIFEAINQPKLSIAAFVTFFCGLRLNEICRLKVEDVDLMNRRLKVVDSKNPNRSVAGYGKDRYVPIPRKAIGPITKWLEIIGADSKWFLPSMTTPDAHIRGKSLYEQFRDSLRRSNLLIPTLPYIEKTGPHKGIQKARHKYYFHTLRHSYATYLLSKGVDIYTISNLLGHNQVTTTQIYAKINTTQQKLAVEDAFSAPLMEFRPNHQQGMRQVEQPMQNNESLERLRLEVERNRIELEKMKMMRGQIIVERMV
ncbi:tyrosine-type recombinase/integrase [Candidatus Woesearchaeota archaeon]|nr:tyrosine-type recombinase/integrase [Candidatus Woesearchaeota archaeon]